MRKKLEEREREEGKGDGVEEEVGWLKEEGGRRRRKKREGKEVRKESWEEEW